MFVLFYVLVLSVPAIDCFPYDIHNFNILNPACLSLILNDDTLLSVGRLLSLSDTCPTESQRVDSNNFCRERTDNYQEEFKRSLNIPKGLRTNDSLPRDVDGFYQRSLAFNGTDSKAGGQFPRATKIVLSSKKNESSSLENAQNPFLLNSSNLNKIRNDSQWMHEEYEAHDEGNSSDNSFYMIRLDTINVTQKINKLVRNYFRSNPSCQNAEIKFCKDVSGEFLRVNLIDVPSQPSKRLGTSGYSAPCNESNFSTWVKNNGLRSHEKAAGFVVDEVVCFLALPVHDEYSEFLTNRITSNEEHLFTHLLDLGVHVTRVVESSEFRLESQVTITAINNILTYLDYLLEDIEAFGVHFNHYTVTAARLKLLECRRHFTDLQNICYELLNSPYGYNEFDRRGMEIFLNRFEELADEFTVLVTDMIEALKAYEDSDQ